MSRLDVVIFGATGFTGRHAVKMMVDFASKYHVASWGIAGRSEYKLQHLIKELNLSTEGGNVDIKTIIADVDDEQSLKDMCAQCKVIVNCCGPYRLYGEPVVKAAIDSKTHYIDVSGEPGFMELMQLRYSEMAREAGVYVISACGWDSIPADMGVVFLQQNFEGTLNCVRSYVDVHVSSEGVDTEGRGVINHGTWESLVHALATWQELRSLRKMLYPQPLPVLKPKITRELFTRKPGKSSFYLPFLGSDESVVYRTQRYLYDNENQRFVQFKAYVHVGNYFHVFLALMAAAMLFVLAKFSITRDLLLRYPKFFSMGKVTMEGPSKAVMENTHFSFELIGEGWEKGAEINSSKPQKKLIAKISGVNPGYGATCAALLASAVTILTEKDKMPPTGGVYTTGVAFRNTGLINKLIEHGVKYELVHPK